MTLDSRRCSRCQLSLPLSEFRKDRKGYWRSHCKSCSLLATQDWRARHHDELLAKRRAAYAEAHTAGWREQRRRWSLTP